MDDRSDRELVDAYLSRRDERSFRDLYRRHSPALYGMAIRLCGSEADAQDAVQEAWIRLCRTLGSFRWESALRTWAIGILINCVREQSRLNGSYREVSDDTSVPEIVVESAPERLSLSEAIARLPQGYRHVLVLHDVEGYTHEEISELLYIAVGTSKSQLHHARRAIRGLYFART